MSAALTRARNREAALMGVAMRSVPDDVRVVYRYSGIHGTVSRDHFDEAWGDHEARAIIAHTLTLKPRDLVGQPGQAEIRYLEQRAQQYIADRLATGLKIEPSIVGLWNHLDLRCIWQPPNQGGR